MRQLLYRHEVDQSQHKNAKCEPIKIKICIVVTIITLLMSLMRK